ncbi:hypothetical protein M5D96_006554 [Drosophila gunungcola]|uniref:Uncharacterized protein n=1 Tax=Drosophila gunungcola TaxID=103775 RepID=A0A9Q0BQM3_9MUSC|nr:hypothetical protein M5D96_006554 [Drosophila gunungcola]
MQHEADSKKQGREQPVSLFFSNAGHSSAHLTMCSGIYADMVMHLRCDCDGDWDWDWDWDSESRDCLIMPLMDCS